MNEYSGITPKGISCGASLSLREGKLEGFATWGDSGAGTKADLSAPVEIVSQLNGVTTVRVSQFNEPTLQMTLVIKDRKVTSMKIEGDDPIWFIPRKFRVQCDQLEQFIPRY